MNKLDKKQIPQFAALCVLSAGVFGYFVMKIVTPSPAAAGTRPRPAGEVAQARRRRPLPDCLGAQHRRAAGRGPARKPHPPGMRRTRPPRRRGCATRSWSAMWTRRRAPPRPPPRRIRLPHPCRVKPSARSEPPPCRKLASIREVAPASVATSALPFGLKGFPAPGGVPGPCHVAPKKDGPGRARRAGLDRDRRAAKRGGPDRRPPQRRGPADRPHRATAWTACTGSSR